MQGSLKRKQSQFRNTIRRQHLQEYKKTRRKEIFQNTLSMPIQQNNDSKLYQTVLQFHELSKLIEMDNEKFNNHLQMLQELVYSQNNFLLIEAFDKILIVLIDFYEEISKQSEMVFRQQFKGEYQNEVIQFFMQTNIFTFLDPYKFFKIMVGVYYQINPSKNIVYLQKSIKIAKSALKFCFIDNSQIQSILQNKIPIKLNYKLNKALPTQFLITIFLNISYSEQQSVLHLIVQQGILQDLSYYIQQYGMTYNAIQPTAGLYSNCIQYLSNLIHQFPVGQELDEQRNDRKINVYYLFLELFQNLIVIQEPAVMRHMIYISQKLINVCLDAADQLRKDIFDKVYNLIGNIAMIQQYIQGSEQLFILFAHEYSFEHDPYPCRLVQLLHIIFTKSLKVYYGEYQQSQKIKYKNEDQCIIQGKVLRQIRKIFQACRQLISRCDITSLDFHQQIVKQVMSFWIKQDLIMGEDELLAFMQVAVQTGKDLSDFLIFGEFKYEFTFLMATDYERDKELQAIILLINAVFTRLEEGIRNQAERNYLITYRSQMETIKQRLQSYCQTPFVSSNPHLYEIGLSLGEKIDRLVSIALNQ